jgi:hypothetical protein
MVAGRGKAPLDVVTVDNNEFFRIWSKTAHNPDLVDLVQSQYSKRVIMLSVQQPVNIVGGYCRVHILPLTANVMTPAPLAPHTAYPGEPRAGESLAVRSPASLIRRPFPNRLNCTGYPQLLWAEAESLHNSQCKPVNNCGGSRPQNAQPTCYEWI